MTTATPEARLAALIADGAARFDPLATGFVASLLARARALTGGAEARLVARAEARIAELEAALPRARAGAEAELASLEALAGEPAPAALRALITRGDFAEATRGARRFVADQRRAREQVALPWLAPIRAAAASRNLKLPEESALDLLSLRSDELVVTRGAQRRAQALGSAISSALFRESVERARAALAVAHASDNAPEAAGPYNPQVLSARALAALAELSPGYLRALIAELDDLAGLKAALEPSPKRPSKATRKRRGGAATA